MYTAPGTVMKYSASLPAGWTRDRTWPVVVVIPDATRDFDGNLAAFAAVGATSPFIFVAPHVVTSGGPLRDLETWTAGNWMRVGVELVGFVCALAALASPPGVRSVT